jgi:hypothetical protein
MLILNWRVGTIGRLTLNPRNPIADARFLIFCEQQLHQTSTGCGFDSEYGFFGFQLEQRFALRDAVSNPLEPANEAGALHHQSDFGNFLCNQCHVNPVL